jgi:hypothetical protein
MGHPNRGKVEDSTEVERQAGPARMVSAGGVHDEHLR